MHDLPILVPALACSVSPSNVRKRSDPAADARLEANIAVSGIRQNLIGVRVARKKGQYRIVGGGRRLACVHRLIEAGTFPNDYLVPVLVLADAAEAVSASLEENFFTLAMNPAEACRAFQDIIETEKKTPAEVAKRFGVTETFVLGRLRLSGLAEPVFDALANGEITLDVAKAYASTSDVGRQAAVFETMSRNTYYGRDVNEIRRQLASYSYTATDPRVLLVGRDAYIAAGGRIDGDLFTNAATERWLDIHIVDRLLEESLVQAACRFREAQGLAEVRVVPSVQVPWTETNGLVPLRGEPMPLTDEEAARLEAIEAELTALYEDQPDQDDIEATEGFDAKVDALEAEQASLSERPAEISDEQKANAIGYVVVGHDGQPRLHAQLYVEPAPVEEGEPGEGDDGEDGAGAAEAVADAGPKLSQRLLDELAMMKTELIAVHIARDPAFALDLGTFIMVERAERLYNSGLPSELRASRPSAPVTGFESGTAAAGQWRELDEALDRSWRDHDSLEGRYDAFCALDQEARAAWLGWAIARTLEAVPAGRSGSGFLDHIGAKLAIDVAVWWRPTARTYFDRVTRAMILSLFEEVGGPELRQRHGAAKKHDLALAAEKIFAGEALLDAAVKARALDWVPDQMRFERGVPADTPATEAGRANDGPVPDADGEPSQDIAKAA
jgi:ParB family chromosome partitioning protein